MKRKRTTADPKMPRRKPMDNPQKKMEKVPASMMAPFLGLTSLKRLQMVSKSGLLYDQQISKKEMTKAIMYSIFWTLDNHRHLPNTLIFHFRNPTTPSRRVTVRLRNTSGFASTAKQFIVTIYGGGDDQHDQYTTYLDGIRISNRLEFSYELPIPSKRNVVETFFHWLIEKYFSKIDLNQSTKFAYFYDGISHHDQPAASKAASDYSNFLKLKSKSSPSTEHAVVTEMKCCFEWLMSPLCKARP